MGSSPIWPGHDPVGSSIGRALVIGVSSTLISGAQTYLRCEETGYFGSIRLTRVQIPPPALAGGVPGKPTVPGSI